MEPFDQDVVAPAERQKNLTAFQGYQLYAYPLAKIALLEARIAELEKTVTVRKSGIGTSPESETIFSVGNFSLVKRTLI
jgi:hypothetical protein